MISGISTEGMVEITATDLGFDIPEALEVERELG